MEPNYKTILIFSCLLLMGLTACSVNVPLDASMYSTQISADKFSQYQGKQIYLGSFANKAENTSLFHFYNQDKSVTYGGPLLNSFFWHCFNSALLEIGIGVYEHEAPPGVAQLNFTLFHLDDASIKFNVILKKDTFQIFKKDYLLDMERQESKDPKILEERAYRFMDLIITTILDDEEFKEAFFRKEVHLD